MKVKIEIELGNEAMQTGFDVAQALRELATRIADDCNPIVGDTLKIRDTNGNTVGTYLVRK